MAILSSFERRASVSAHTLHRDGSTVYVKWIFYSHLKLHLPQQRATWTLFLACTHWTALLSTCQLHTCQPSGGTRPGAIPRMFVQEEQELKLQATHLILLSTLLHLLSFNCLGGDGHFRQVSREPQVLLQLQRRQTWCKRWMQPCQQSEGDSNPFCYFRVWTWQNPCFAAVPHY